MSFNQKKFLDSMPSSFTEVFAVLKSFGFTPTLVGGVVRDFILQGIVGRDWDMELSHPTVSFNKSDWKDFGVALSKLGKITHLPYEIIRLEIKNIEYEFSPPRIETFTSEKGHSNFTAEFDFSLPFEKAVLRRDFTVNSLGIRFTSSKEFTMLDPLNGLVHLRDKTLHHTNENFSKDPVRFLRALRFVEKMKFHFSTELENVLKEMPVEGLSHRYIWTELQKSKNPIGMLKTLLQWQEGKPDLKLPVDAKIMAGKWESLQSVLSDSSKNETWLIALEWIGVSSQEWQKFFSVSSDTSRRLARWAQNSKIFSDLKPEKFHGEFEQVRDFPEFATLFDWYFTTKQLLQKNPELPLMKMIEEYLPDWIHLYRFEPVKDVKHIDPPFRAKYQVWNICQRL
jgi:tRNA nucleotidyltransferase/poly(A) polymerase